MSRPYFQFYPGDWLKDPNLSYCSLEARGVWIELLCFMAESENPGVLQTNGTPWTVEQAAEAVRGDSVTIARQIRDMISNNVITVLKSGALASKKMMREENKKAGWRARTKKTRDVTPVVTPVVTPKSHLSSSSSSYKRQVSTPAPASPASRPMKISTQTEYRRSLGRAIADATGFEARSKADHARITKLVKTLVECDATPDEVAVRAKRYAATWPKVTLTMEALVKHWGHFTESRAPLASDEPWKAKSKPGKYKGR